MRTLQLASFAALALVLSLASCKKDEEVKTKTQLLTAKAWKLTALTVDPAIVNPITQTTITDAYAQRLPCENDDLTTFKDNNTAILDEGPSKCSSTDPQTETVNWSFNSTETIITLDGLDYQLIELTESKMVAKYTENFGGIVYTFTATFQ